MLRSWKPRNFRLTNAPRGQRAVDDIPLTEDAADLSYAATATVGGQTLELVLDTGSAVSCASKTLGPVLNHI